MVIVKRFCGEDLSFEIINQTGPYFMPHLNNIWISSFCRKNSLSLSQLNLVPEII